MVVYAVYPHDNYSTDAPVASFSTRSLAEAWIKRQHELCGELRAISLADPYDDAALDAWYDAHEDFVDSRSFGIAALDVDPPLP